MPTRYPPPNLAARIGHLAAVMIGGLAVVISGCMILAIYGRRHVPGYDIT